MTSMATSGMDRNVGEMLKSLLSRGGKAKTTCGPSWDRRDAYFIDVREKNKTCSFSSPYVVPDATYHPEVYVTIDFLYQFVPALKIGKIIGKRILSFDRLQEVARKLREFYAFYWDYSYTYGKTSNKLESLNTTINNATKENEDNLALFVNKIVNYFVTQVSTQRSLSDIGTCTITLRDTPWYYNQKLKTTLFADTLLNVYDQLFLPMLPITVYAKGRFYRDYYFPIFDGFITHVESSDSDGFNTVTVRCRDALEVARFSQDMLSPSALQVEELQSQQAINPYEIPLYGVDHFEMVKLLILGGKLVPKVGGGFEVIVKDQKLPAEQVVRLAYDQLLDFTNAGGEVKPANDSSVQTLNYYLDNAAIHTDNFTNEERFRRTARRKKGLRGLVMWGSKITPYRILSMSGIETFKMTFSSRLDVLRHFQKMVFYELYIDAAGNVQYHPKRLGNIFFDYSMFYATTEGNVTVKVPQPFPGVYIFGPEERKSLVRNFNADQLTTYTRFTGSPHVKLPNGELVSNLLMAGNWTDEYLLSRFGYRRMDAKNEMINYKVEVPLDDGSKIDIFKLAAREHMAYANAELRTCDATLICRPEIDLANPVYLPDYNEVFYLQSISHSITIGGDATTNISANFGRKPDVTPPDFMSLVFKQDKLQAINKGKGTSVNPSPSGLRANETDQSKKDAASVTDKKSAKQDSRKNTRGKAETAKAAGSTPSKEASKKAK